MILGFLLGRLPLECHLFRRILRYTLGTGIDGTPFPVSQVDDLRDIQHLLEVILGVLLPTLTTIQQYLLIWAFEIPV